MAFPPGIAEMHGAQNPVEDCALHARACTSGSRRRDARFQADALQTDFRSWDRFPASRVSLCVTHSGVTLAPLLGDYMASELIAGQEEPMLAPFNRSAPRRIMLNAQGSLDVECHPHEPGDFVARSFFLDCAQPGHRFSITRAQASRFPRPFASATLSTFLVRRCNASDDFVTQATSAMDAVGKELQLAGASMDDVYRCTIALTDMNNWDAFNTVYLKYFKKDRFPVRMSFGVTSLGGAAVEVQCEAHLDK